MGRIREEVMFPKPKGRGHLVGEGATGQGESDGDKYPGPSLLPAVQSPAMASRWLNPADLGVWIRQPTGSAPCGSEESWGRPRTDPRPKDQGPALKFNHPSFTAHRCRSRHTCAWGGYDMNQKSHRPSGYCPVQEININRSFPSTMTGARLHYGP